MENEKRSRNIIGEKAGKAVWQARRLAEAEKRDCRELWEEIFTEDSKEFLDYYDRWKYAENECYGIYDGSRLVSMVQLNPYEIQVKGGSPKVSAAGLKESADTEAARLVTPYQTVSSCYIVAVATREEYRHQGMMSRLLKESLDDLRKQGMPFVFLMPAAEAIYYPFGFRYFYETNAGALRYGEASGMDGCEYPGESRKLLCRLAGCSDIDELVWFSEKIQAELFDCFTRRDRHYYEMLLEELKSEKGGLLLLTEPEKDGLPGTEELPGTVSAKGAEFVAAVPYWGKEPVEIREILCRPCDKKRVLETLFWWFGPAAGQEPEKISIVGAPFGLETKKPVIMGRIVNVVNFLELFSAEQPVEILLELSDTFLEDNDGFYRWSLSPAGSTVRRPAGFLQAAGLEVKEGQAAGKLSEPEVVRCTEAELFSCLMGMIEPEGPLRKVRACREIYINEIV